MVGVNYRRYQPLILLLVLFIVRFYKPLKLEGLLKLFDKGHIGLFLTVLFPFVLCRGRLMRKDLLCIKTIKFYLFFLVLNIASCYYFRGQSPYVSFICWASYLLILYYPTFASWNCSSDIWEKLLRILFKIILCAFLIQYIFIRKQLFILDTDFDYLQVETRIRLFSDGILYLGSLLYFNKYLSTNRKSYLILFALGSLSIFLQGFRVVLLSYSLSSLVMYLRIKKIGFSLIKNFFLIMIPLLCFLQTNVAQNKINEILDRNESANFDDDSYVRVLLVDYYYSEHFINNIELVLGSGLPALNSDNPSKAPSAYSKYCSQNAVDYHFYPVDMGLMGLSWNTGIPFVLCFIILLIQMAITKVPSSYYYLNSWALFLLIAGLITHPACYYHHNVIYLSIALTILNSAVIKKAED
jgi:hypothetical protein